MTDFLNALFVIIGFYATVYVAAFLAAKGWYRGRGKQIYEVNLPEVNLHIGKESGKK